MNIKPLFRGRLPRMQGKADLHAPVTQGELDKVVRAIELATTENGLGDLEDVDLLTTAPADGDVLQYNATQGKWLPAAQAAGGSDVFHNKVWWYKRPTGFTTSSVTEGITIQEIGGLGTGTEAWSATSYARSVPHHYKASLASTNADAGWYGLNTDAYYCGWRGDSAGEGGFLFRARVAIKQHPSGSRAFIGVASTANMLGLGANDPSTYLDMIGYGWDSADAQWYAYRNDNAGTASHVATGETRTVDKVYQVEIECGANSTAMTMRLQSVDGDGITTIHEATYTTNLPSNTLKFGPRIFLNTGSGSTAAHLRMYFAEGYWNG